MLFEDILDRPNCKNWCSLLRDMLFTLGLADVWYSQNVGNVKLFLMSVKQKLKDQFLQNWSSRLDNSSRAGFYSLTFCSFYVSTLLRYIKYSTL